MDVSLASHSRSSSRAPRQRTAFVYLLVLHCADQFGFKLGWRKFWQNLSDRSQPPLYVAAGPAVKS
ncbi:hypothetical protein FRC12_007138, partial [Ceratobasidium sp. 428]